MNKAAMYISIWGLMAAATLLEIFIFTTNLSELYKVFTIMGLAFAQALTNVSFFQNLRYEPKVVTLLPLLAFVGLQTLVLTATLSVGR